LYATGLRIPLGCPLPRASPFPTGLSGFAIAGTDRRPPQPCDYGFILS